MFRRTTKKLIPLIAIALCLCLLCSCGGAAEGGKQQSQESQQQSQQKEETQSNQPQQQPLQQPENPPQREPENPPLPPENPPQDPEPVHDPKAGSDAFKSIKAAADKGGIYSVTITLSDKAADKGEVEMVYHGEKGSPQENSVVNTFLIKYYKEEAGTFEINTFFDGEVYQNLHHKTEVKVNNTFSANLRAGDVTVYYTPDGGERQEVFYTDSTQCLAE